MMMNRKNISVNITIIGVYGLIIFFFLFVENIPVEYRKLYSFSYTYLEYLFFSAIFWFTFTNKRIKRFILIASLSFLAFLLIYYSYNKIQRLDSVPVGIETILIFIYIFLFFYQSSRNIQNLYIYNHYCFWIAAGIFIYLGGSFFYFILINHLNKDQIASFQDLTYVAEIIKNVLFGIAIFVYSKQPKAKASNSENVPLLDMI